jgi:hypothetical protein
MKWASKPLHTNLLALLCCVVLCCAMLFCVCAHAGVAYHHAGLTTQERVAVEAGYRRGCLVVSALCGVGARELEGLCIGQCCPPSVNYDSSKAVQFAPESNLCHASPQLPNSPTLPHPTCPHPVQVLTATSTLAAGINLPARRVILRSLQQGIGPVLREQYLQMVGR